MNAFGTDLAFLAFYHFNYNLMFYGAFMWMLKRSCAFITQKCPEIDVTLLQPELYMAIWSFITECFYVFPPDDGASEHQNMSGCN
jgi:hypothetical protein